ncbi:hypothetical protein [Streptomyces sp. NPDC015242]|uniref:hypothetical protein n=1 Tax=Streptomyces sp. NPDC015242 TaxID=3364951 RepID=UPI0036FD6081
MLLPRYFAVTLRQRIGRRVAEGFQLGMALQGPTAARRPLPPACLIELPVYAGYRLPEQSMNAWDIEAALNPPAIIPAPETRLLWQRLDLISTRFRDAETLTRLAPAQLSLTFTEPAADMLLNLSAELRLYPCEPAEPTGHLTGAAKAVLCLVCGRHQPTAEIQVTGTVTLDDRQSLLPRSKPAPPRVPTPPPGPGTPRPPVPRTDTPRGQEEGSCFR